MQHRTLVRRIVFSLTLLLVVAACGEGSFAAAAAFIRPDGLVEFLRSDGSVAASLVVEIAETSEAQSRGLMGRVLNDLTGGMLFLFSAEQPQTFWMHNTPTSLDIIFIDARGRVVNIAARTTPFSDQTYASAGPAQFVVEAKAGFAERFGILPGCVMRWRRLR